MEKRLRSFPAQSMNFQPEKELADNTPYFYRFTVDIAELQDTFLKFPGVKGCVWINGFNIGRYWNKGPGDALYVPRPVLPKGRNEVIVLELYRLDRQEITFSAERNWTPC